MLFIAFWQEDLLYLTGTVEVIWEGGEIRHDAGVERLLRFHHQWGYRVAVNVLWRWLEPEVSPFLEPLGS